MRKRSKKSATGSGLMAFMPPPRMRGLIPFLSLDQTGMPPRSKYFENVGKAKLVWKSNAHYVEIVDSGVLVSKLKSGIPFFLSRSQASLSGIKALSQTISSRLV
jgi:hypothetical protein